MTFHGGFTPWPQCPICQNKLVDYFWQSEDGRESIIRCHGVEAKGGGDLVWSWERQIQDEIYFR